MAAAPLTLPSLGQIPPAEPFTIEPLVLGGGAAKLAAAVAPSPVQAAPPPAAVPEAAPVAAAPAPASAPVQAAVAAAAPITETSPVAPRSVPADGAASTEAPAEAVGAEAQEGVEPSEEELASAAGSEASAQGFLGRMKTKVAQTEKFQKASQFVANKANQIKETEKYQKSMEFVKQKTTDLVESERVQKGLEKAKETAKNVSEKTKETIDGAKVRYQAVKEGVGGVWSKGKGSIERVKANVRNGEWRGSARDTLACEERQEQWKDMRVQGAEEMTVPARTEHTSAYHVSKGSTLRWTFRVKEHDIGFGVRMRVQEWGGSREDEVLEVERYDCQDTISGSWVADENRTIILAFDNKYSRLRGKTVAYMVGTEKPPVFTEPVQPDASVAADASVASPEAAAAPAAAAAEVPVVETPAAVAPKPKAIV